MILRNLYRHILFSSAVLYRRLYRSSFTRFGSIKTQFQIVPLFVSSKFLLHASTFSDDNVSDRKLFQAIVYGQNDRLKKAIQSSTSPNTRHEFGWTLLHAAVINKNKQAIKILIDNGADLNSGDEYVNLFTTSTAKRVLPMTVYKCREDEFYGHLSITNSFSGFTALHYAALIDDSDIVKLLLEAGADPLQCNDTGHRPSAYALPNVQKELLAAERKLEDEKQRKLLEEKRRNPIEKHLSEGIVGQESAIDAVAAVIRRKESGWCSDDKPLVLLFLGSSGVGKTALAKQIAKYLHGSSKSGFVRIDMSEYQEKHEVSKFIGAPPGYVGFEEGGQLTEALLKNPNAVVLLDEVDKAHSDVLTIMLQLFDEGRLTDGKGKTIDGSKALYIMTCNLGNSEISNYAIKQRSLANKDNIEISKLFKENIMKPILKRNFRRDEFLGRINEIVYFLPFSENEIRQLVIREMEFWSSMATSKHNIKIDWDESVIDIICAAYDVTYGARSLKHEVDRKIISLVAKAHEQGLVGSGSNIRIGTDADKKDIVIRKVSKGLLGVESLKDITFKKLD
ncbi:hypothetical protein GJ496_002426 [Pomphorhynchus laevis]|nr:hypothetical protein GJ496_002426 [Pomphorhynchus laevis]